MYTKNESKNERKIETQLRRKQQRNKQANKQNHNINVWTKENTTVQLKNENKLHVSCLLL